MDKLILRLNDKMFYLDLTTTYNRKIYEPQEKKKIYVGYIIERGRKTDDHYGSCRLRMIVKQKSGVKSG